MRVFDPIETFVQLPDGPHVALLDVTLALSARDQPPRKARQHNQGSPWGWIVTPGCRESISYPVLTLC